MFSIDQRRPVPASPACTLAATILAVAIVISPASAQVFEFDFISNQSTLAAEFDMSAPIVGHLIGNHDPVSNPGGTQTKTGIFQSGNHPIPYTATLVVASAGSGINTQPAGQFTMDVNLDAGQVFLEDLWLDALGGAAPVADATLNIIYQTFYTSNPTDFFPGGINIPIPLGEIEITTLTINQVEGTSALGTLDPLAGNQYTLMTLVEVELIVEAEFLGDVISPGPIPLELFMSGTLTVIDAENAQLAIEVSVSFEETNKGPFQSFDNVPLEIPGPLSGQTVHLLLSGVIESIDVAMSVEADLLAHGVATEPPCPVIPGDLNCNGNVGVADLLILLGQWGPCADCRDCPADLTGSCTVGVADLLILLANWG